MKHLLLISSLVLFLSMCSRSNEQYPWTDSKMPEWVIESLKYDSKVLVEQVGSGPVNAQRPLLWCYKYKDVIIIYDINKQGHITKRTVWKD